MIGPFGGGGGGVAASAYMRALLLEPNAAAARVALGLGSAAESDASDFAAAVHTHSAADIVSGTIGAARLGSGTPDATKFLRGDSAWVVIDLSAYETIVGAAATYLPLVGGTLSGALTIAGPEVAVSTPLLTITQTWNAGAVKFTGIKHSITDTASAATSLFADFQVGGSSVFAIHKSGALYVGALPTGLGGFEGLPAIWLSQPGFGGQNVGMYAYSLAVNIVGFNGAAYNFRSDYFGIGQLLGSVQLVVDANNVLAMKVGTNAQTFRVYGTTTGNKYLSLAHDGTNAILGASSGDMIFSPGAEVFRVGTDYVRFGTHVGIGAETVTGYMIVKDLGGTDRKVAIVS